MILVHNDAVLVYGKVMVPGDVRHYGDTESHCTGVAVILEMLYQGVNLPLTDVVFVSEDSHGV